jgi:hypothetical protein
MVEVFQDSGQIGGAGATDHPYTVLKGHMLSSRQQTNLQWAEMLFSMLALGKKEALSAMAAVLEVGLTRESLFEILPRSETRFLDPKFL